MVGQRDGRELQLLGLGDELLELGRPVEEAVLRVHVQVDELGVVHEGRLLELDRGRGLVGDVVEHGVDTAGSAASAAAISSTTVGRQPGEVRGHAVPGVHRPQHDRLAAGAAPSGTMATGNCQIAS